jgi:hypothetical protein
MISIGITDSKKVVVIIFQKRWCCLAMHICWVAADVDTTHNQCPDIQSSQ